MCVFSSVTQSCLTLCDPMNRSMPGLPVLTNYLSSLRLTSIESVMLSSHLILCLPLLLLSPIPPSIRIFSSESTLCMRWPKYWSFSFSITVQETGIKIIPMEKKCKKAKWLSEEAIQIAVKKKKEREVKSKGEKEDIAI